MRRNHRVEKIGNGSVRKRSSNSLLSPRTSAVAMAVTTTSSDGRLRSNAGTTSDRRRTSSAGKAKISSARPNGSARTNNALNSSVRRVNNSARTTNSSGARPKTNDATRNCSDETKPRKTDAALIRSVRQKNSVASRNSNAMLSSSVATKPRKMAAALIRSVRQKNNVASRNSNAMLSSSVATRRRKMAAALIRSVRLNSNVGKLMNSVATPTCDANRISRIKSNGALDSSGRLKNSAAWLKSSDEPSNSSRTIRADSGTATALTSVATLTSNARRVTVRTASGINRPGCPISNAMNGADAKSSPGVNVKISFAIRRPSGNASGANANDNSSNSGD